MTKPHRELLINSLNTKTRRKWDHATGATIVVSGKGQKAVFVTRDSDGVGHICDENGNSIQELGVFKHKGWTDKLAEAVATHLKSAA